MLFHNIDSTEATADMAMMKLSCHRKLLKKVNQMSKTQYNPRRGFLITARKKVRGMFYLAVNKG